MSSVYGDDKDHDIAITVCVKSCFKKIGKASGNVWKCH